MVLTSSHGEHQSQFNRVDHKKRQKSVEELMAGEDNASYFTSQKKETLLKVCVYLVGLHHLFAKRCESQLDTVKILLG